MGQFDRKAFKQSGESLFDEMFVFERNLKDKMAYAITMKNGNSEQKKKLHQLENSGYNFTAIAEIFYGAAQDFKTLPEGLLTLMLNADNAYDDFTQNQIPFKKKGKKRKS